MVGLAFWLLRVPDPSVLRVGLHGKCQPALLRLCSTRPISVMALSCPLHFSHHDNPVLTIRFSHDNVGLQRGENSIENEENCKT